MYRVFDNATSTMCIVSNPSGLHWLRDLLVVREEDGTPTTRNIHIPVLPLYLHHVSFRIPAMRRMARRIDFQGLP